MHQLFQSANHLPAVCAAALGLLLFALSVAISVHRVRTRTFFGVPADPSDPLTKLVRTQTNTAEYVAVLALPILWLGTMHAPPWVTAMMILAVASRYLFAFGMLTSRSIANPHAIRAIGATGTYVAGISLYIALVVYWVAPG